MHCSPFSIFLWLSTPLVIIVLYFKYSYQYWEKKKVPTPKTYIPFGNMENPFTTKKHVFEQITNCYREFKEQGAKYLGFYTFAKPNFVPIDLELVKAILGKDFAHFSDRGTYYNEVDDPLTAHLFSLESTKWKSLRAKFTPTFTPVKMKGMFPTVIEIVQQLEQEVFKLHDNREPLHINDLFARYTTDIIGSCVFGMDCNSFVNPNSDFRKFGKMMVDVNLFNFVKQTLSLAYPNFFRKTHIRVLPNNIHDFFMNLTKRMVQLREEGVTRKDFLQILVDLKNSPGSTLTVTEIAAQSFIFLLAGFETSSSAMTFCLFELARNPESQDKVRQEVEGVLEKYQGKITYESLLEMKYLDQTLNESMRKYPSLNLLNRQCTKTYNIPGTDVIIEKGTNVFIPVYAIHNDPEYYPNPERFDPDRFSEENKATRHPFAHLPFGEGPRNCIGVRFGLMLTKVGLVVMLKNFKWAVNEKTKLPLTFNPVVFPTRTNETIWLDAEKV